MMKITMPQAGNTMEDGTIVRWAKAEGSRVEKGEVLLEVQTDKANIELESTAGGVLRKILVAEGQTVPVHAVLAILSESGEDIAAAVAEAEATNSRLAAELAGKAQQAAPAVAPVVKPAPAPAPARPAPPPVVERPAEQAAPAAKAVGGVVPILMPQVGNTMEEGTIVRWHAQVGQRISQGQVVFEVETDKAVVEVEAVDSGRLARIVVAEGQTLSVKQPVAYIAETDAELEAYLAGGAGAAAPAAVQAEAPAAAAETAARPAAAPTVPAGTRVKASPAARKIAAERGVDLASIGPGSGPEGRIISSDVLAARAPAAAGGPARRRLTGMRKAIARNLQASKQTIPHFYARLTIDAGPMQDFYRQEKAKYQCTINDVVVLACGRVLGEMSAFRCRLQNDELVEFPSANVGIAVGLEGGLVVPVVLGVERMTLRQLGAESRRVVEAARGGKVENMGQGVFTITNLGMFGIEEFTAIINPPESAILAVGAIREQVVVSGGAMRPGRVMTLTLSADHRVVDGVLSAKFLQRLREILESPAQLA